MQDKNRIVLLDILRAIGVMLMIEGHTVDAVLSPVYKDAGSTIFQFWTFFRGLTAPFFFFSAGLAFVVATVRDSGGSLSVSHKAKLRRVRRIAMLLFLGYLLHFPAQLLYNPSNVSSGEWKIFYLADALQIISLSLLVILAISILAKRKGTLLRWYVIAAFVSLAIAPLTEPIVWEKFTSPFIYSYLTCRSGSFFTFFPFSAYLFAGASFGAAAISLPADTRAHLLSGSFMKAAIVSLLLFMVFYPIQVQFVSPAADYWKALPAVNLLRFGLVTLVASVVGYASLGISSFPRILPAIGRSSLTVYVVHLMIVYGSPVNKGLAQLLPDGVHPLVAALLAAGVMLLMFGMVYTIEAHRTRKRRPTAVTIGEIAK